MSFNIGDNIIDSRDIIERLNELTDERDGLQNAVEEARDSLDSWDGATEDDAYEEREEALEDAEKALLDWIGDYGDELKNLEEFESEFGGYGDWRHGETLILDSYFADYAQQLAEDTCDMRSANCWPYTCIDWKQAAEELKVDYMSATIDGYEYWMRA